MSLAIWELGVIRVQEDARLVLEAICAVPTGPNGHVDVNPHFIEALTGFDKARVDDALASLREANLLTERRQGSVSPTALGRAEILPELNANADSLFRRLLSDLKPHEVIAGVKIREITGWSVAEINWVVDLLILDGRVVQVTQVTRDSSTSRPYL